MSLLLEKRFKLIEKACGHTRRSKDGINISIECPFCNKNNGKTKLVIRVDNPVYHCWVCEKSGKDVTYLFSRFFKRFLDEAKSLFKSKKITLEDGEKEVAEICLPADFELCPNITKGFNPNKLAVKKYAALSYKTHTTIPAYEAKSIEYIIDQTPIVSQKQIELWEWISTYYMSPFGSVYRAAMPSILLLESETELHFHKLPSSDVKLSTNAKQLLASLREYGLFQVSDVTS